MKRACLFMGFVLLCAAQIYAAGATAETDPGKALYEKTKCAACHGADLSGNKNMAKMLNVDISRMDLKISSSAKAEDIAQIIAKGKGKMPSYQNKLKPEEVKLLAAYIAKMKTPKGAGQPIEKIK